MLILFVDALIGIMLAIALLMILDEDSSIKVPFLHHRFANVDLVTRYLFQSDAYASTVRCIKKFKTFSISNICRLFDRGE